MKKKFEDEEVPFILGWIHIEPKEAKAYLDTYGGNDIKRAASCLGWVKATNQSIVHGKVHDFEFGDYTYRMNVQGNNQNLIVPESEIDYADIHVMTYWHEAFDMIFMGWQWSKVLKRNPPKKNWLTDKRMCYIQSRGNIRDLEDLLNQIIPERVGGVQVVEGTQEAML